MNHQDDWHWAAQYRLSAHQARHWAKAAKSESMRLLLLKLAVEYEVLAADRERTSGFKK